MLELNKEYEFKIIDLGMNFEGVAKTEDGLTVFIPEALNEEIVTAKIIKINKSYALGLLKEVVKKAEYRCKPKCKYYDKCGGCEAMHMTYEATLNSKKEKVVNNIVKQGLDKDLVINIYGMNEPFYYRNKVQYPVKRINNRNVLGMYEKGSHDIVNNEECYIQDRLTHKVARYAFSVISKRGLNGYDEKSLTGDIRNIMVRRGTNTGEIMLVFVVTSRNLKNDSRMIESINEITKNYNCVTSVVLNVNSENTNVILSSENICVYGKEYITDKIGRYEFKITADSFFQVNTLQAEKLYSLLKENMKLEKDKTLLELYSGVGSIGIYLSDAVKDIYAVEIVKSAVDAAKENAKLNNVENIIHVLGDATKETLKLQKSGKFFDYIVVDPPRKGLDTQGVELILKLAPTKIGYVSCNSATLARDLKLLSSKYTVENIELVDMFPWTSHVECVSVLKLKENSEKQVKIDMLTCVRNK